MTLLTAFGAIAAFLIAFSHLKILTLAQAAMTIAGDATGTMRNPNLNDAEKELAVKAAAISMLRASGGLVLRVGALVLVSIAPIYLFDFIGLSTKGDVFAFLSEPLVILLTSLGLGAAAWALYKTKRQHGGYSPLDRFLHRLAFGAPFLQTTASDIEQTLFRAELARVNTSPPIFITSLPRAGTTVVLNALHEVPGVATHLYRDMPFVMAPMLWNRFGRAAQNDIVAKERAHGDGLMIDANSPEAFEEILWRRQYPTHYHAKSIDLWQPQDQSTEVTEIFNSHFQKIIALRNGPHGRYVSKNNGNIARLDLLDKMFPGCTIIVPFRDPAEHAASLHRQHLNFLEQHRRDPFTKRYMNDIGHLEFGALHRPIAYEGMEDQPITPEDLNYWLHYWIACFDHVMTRSDVLHLVSESNLQSKPQQTMQQLCKIAGVDPADVDFKQYFRKIDKRTNPKLFDPELLKSARRIHAELSKLST